MSDYSPPPSPNAFDDLEDVLYDADPAPDLADELASHALHSPLLYAAEFEPGYDLQEYYSDWDYYSDDYYDDDPSILRTNPVDGSPVKTSHSKQESAKSNRSRKRKLADRDTDVPPLEGDRQYLEACMKGTVWAQPVPTRENTYKIGQGEKVALLKDWRAKFGTASPKKGQQETKAKPSLPEDESWANDLSLADMGLLNARGSIAQPAEEEDDGDQDVNVQDEGEEYEEDDELAEDEAAGDEMLEEKARTRGDNKAVSLGTQSRQASADLDEPEVEEQPSKRRKGGKATAQPVLPSPPATNGSTASTGARRTRQRADSTSTTASVAASKSDKLVKPSAAPVSKISRKRKASPAEDDVEIPALPKSRATATTTSSRAKRVASTTNNVVSDKTKVTTAAANGPTRATRSKKK